MLLLLQLAQILTRVSPLLALDLDTSAQSDCKARTGRLENEPASAY